MNLPSRAGLMNGGATLHQHTNIQSNGSAQNVAVGGLENNGHTPQMNMGGPSIPGNAR
jgi:hypothetical protein